MAILFASALLCTGSLDAHPLLTWLAGHAGAQTGPVELRSSKSGDGFGVHLSHDVAAGETLFVVPATAFVGIDDALSHPLIGEALSGMCDSDDSGGVPILAGLIAYLRLNGESSPYLKMLPVRADERQQHVLWWTEAEVSLLVGTSAHSEALSLRAEAEAISHALLTTALARDVARHGEDAVRDAVYAALVCVLSRGYGMQSADGRPCKTLVPLLDAINHDGHAPTVTYAFSGGGGDGGGGDGLLIARSACDQQAGAELLVSYGAQSDLVYAMHYGFVPSHRDHASACSTTLLQLQPALIAMAKARAEATARGGEARREAGDGSVTAGSVTASESLGAAAVRDAQLRAEQLMSGAAQPTRMRFDVDEWLALCATHAPVSTPAGGARVQGASASTWQAEWEAHVRSEPHEALATLLAAAEDAQFPLEFDVSLADLDAAADRTRLLGLRICARLCAWMRDGHDGRSDSDEEEEEEAALVGAMVRLLLTGCVDASNDADAASLIAAAAAAQLDIMLPCAQHDAEVAGGVRPCCVALAQALRQSEARVLRRIRDEAANVFR